MVDVIDKKLNFNSTKLKELFLLLNQYGNIRIVGGAVRDGLLGIESKDIDLVSDLLPEEVTAILENNNIKSIPTGVKYGTLTCVMDKEIFEITTLRKDIKCLGRKVVVEFTKDFKQDALRRDFTINSMSYDYLSHKIYDYTGGYKDLLQNKVVFIGDPYKRVEEDYLRILRFFRFSSKYSDNIDLVSLDAICKLIKGLELVSFDRIYEEIKLLFTTKNCYKIINVIQIKKLSPYIFLGLEFDIKIIKRAFGLNLDAISIIGASITNNIDDIRGILYKLRFSKKEIKKIIFIQNIKLLLEKESLEFVIKLCKLNNSYDDSIGLISLIITNQPVNKIEYYNNLAVPYLPVSSIDFIKSGLKKKNISDAIEKSKLLWIRSNFLIKKKDLIQDSL